MSLRAALPQVLPDERRVVDGDSVLDQHGRDLSLHVPRRPDVVVFPESTDEVARVDRRAPGRRQLPRPLHARPGRRRGAPARRAAELGAGGVGAGARRTCTGEHGIELGKLGDLLPLKRGIKPLLDPAGILNPGRVVVE